jgi:hypothetical protein
MPLTSLVPMGVPALTASAIGEFASSFQAMAGIGDPILFLFDYIQEHIPHAPVFPGTMSTGMGAANDGVDSVHAMKSGTREQIEHSVPLS